MKIKNLLNYSVLGLSLVSIGVNAQESNKIIPCNTYAAMEDAFKADPAAKVRYDKSQEQFKKEYADYTANRTANKGAAVPVYTIPVVFHVLHEGGAENVADASLIYALDYANKDFARLNADAANTSAPFNASYIDSEIKFMLAKKRSKW